MRKTFILTVDVDPDATSEKVTDAIGISGLRMTTLYCAEAAEITEALSGSKTGTVSINSFQAFVRYISQETFSDKDALCLMWIGWHANVASHKDKS
jgi:hypothetical protein